MASTLATSLHIGSYTLLKYIAKRILFLIPVLIGISFITFTLMHSIPGGPFDVEGIQSEAARKNLEEIYHLDEPFLVQYALWVGNAVRGDLGTSYRLRGVEVSELIAERFGVSWRLGLAGMFVTLIVGIPFGVLAAIRHNTTTDYTVMFLATAGYSIPNFVNATLLLIVFSVTLSIFPVGGWGTPQQLVLPAIALGLPWASQLARFTRASMLEVLQQDFVRTARAKGLHRRAVIVRHALRNAALPLITVLGTLAAELVTGSVAVETIFSLPGIGQYIVLAINSADYPVIVGLTLFYAGLIVIINLIVDVIYTLIDPRIKF